jgi:hypothetical protein
LRRPVLGSVMKQRVGQRATDPFVEQDEHRPRADPLLGEAVRIRTADALE